MVDLRVRSGYACKLTGNEYAHYMGGRMLVEAKAVDMPLITITL